MILKSGFVKVLRASRKSEIRYRVRGAKKAKFCCEWSFMARARFFARAAGAEVCVRREGANWLRLAAPVGSCQDCRQWDNRECRCCPDL